MGRVTALEKSALDFLIIVVPALLLWAYTGNGSAAWHVAGLLFLAKWLYNILT